MPTDYAIKTPITEMFDIKYPIICGAMMWLGVPRLCEVVADAGGLGTLTAAIYKTEEEFRAAVVDANRRLDGRPFMVAMTLMPSLSVTKEHYEMYLRVCIEEGVQGMEIGGSSMASVLGEGAVDRAKAGNIKLFHKVGSVRHAISCEKVGYDGVYAAGFEEGGHPLADDVTTMVLTPRIVEEVSIPVVTVGGIGDGRTMAAAMALGASGVMMATRFLATSDCCNIHDNHRADFIKRQEYDTEIVAKSIHLQCRVLSNGVVADINRIEAENGTLQDLMPYMTGLRVKEAWETGDLDLGLETLGQSVGLIKDNPTTAELLERMAKEAKSALSRSYRQFA